MVIMTPELVIQIVPQLQCTFDPMICECTQCRSGRSWTNDKRHVLGQFHVLGQLYLWRDLNTSSIHVHVGQFLCGASFAYMYIYAHIHVHVRISNDALQYQD